MPMDLSDTRGPGHSQTSYRLWSITVSALIAGCFAIAAGPASAQDVAVPAKVKSNKVKAAEKAPEADGEQPVVVAKKRDPADAQRTLDSGIKLLQAGKAEQAIQTLTVVISGGNLPAPLMARALYQRGTAYRATAKPALALSDLTSALWLKGGLTDADRADAIQQRSAAYREAGLPDQTDGDGKPAGTAPSRRTIATVPSNVGNGVTASAAPSVTTASLAPDRTPAPTASTSTPLGNLFTNLFGGGSSSTAAPAPVAAAAPSPATSGWSSATSVAAPRVKTASAATAAVASPSAAVVAPAAIPAKAVAEGAVHARMIARSEADAKSLANRLKGEFATQLGGRTANISQTQFGSMGSFFQVRVGPYKTAAEAQDFCKTVKAAGADCVAVTQ